MALNSAWKTNHNRILTTYLNNLFIQSTVRYICQENLLSLPTILPRWFLFFLVFFSYRHHHTRRKLPLSEFLLELLIFLLSVSFFPSDLIMLAPFASRFFNSEVESSVSLFLSLLCTISIWKWISFYFNKVLLRKVLNCFLSLFSILKYQVCSSRFSALLRNLPGQFGLIMRQSNVIKSLLLLQAKLTKSLFILRQFWGR